MSDNPEALHNELAALHHSLETNRADGSWLTPGFDVHSIKRILRGAMSALAQQAATPTGDPDMPVVAYQVLAYGRVQRLVVREDVAGEYVGKYHNATYEGLVRKADADAAIAAARQAATPAPAGWKLVPVEPTEEMLAAAHEGDRAYTLRNFGDVMTVQQGPYDHWVAMLAAAPPATPAAQPAEEREAFEAWWREEQKRTWWEEGDPPPEWSSAYKSRALMAWQARAALEGR